MNYEELVMKIQELFGKADVSKMKEHIAYQFNIEGEAAGAFYAEVSNGKLTIAPFEYFDRDVLFTTSAETLLQIAEGEADPVEAFTQGKLKVEGNFDKALMLAQFTSVKEEKKADTKAAETKAAGKTKTAKKAEAKPARKGLAAAKKTTATKVR